MARLTYREIGKAKYKDNRNLVVSEALTQDGEHVGYSIAKQLVAKEGEKETRVFLKDGIGIVDEEGLIALRDLFQYAVENTRPRT